MFLSLNVERILGSCQLMLPFVHCRACFDIPEMFSSCFCEVTSLWCCVMRVLKLTLVWPMYLDLGLQLQDNS